MKRNMGIGTSAKLVIAPKPLLMICSMPAPPPMKSTAAMTLVMKNPTATGMPSIISPSAEPNRITATQYQAMARVAAAQLGERRAEILPAPQEAAEPGRQRGEGKLDPAAHQPAGPVRGAHVAV